MTYRLPFANAIDSGILDKMHTTSILIDAPPATVWQILSDLEAWPEWTPTMLQVKRLDTGPVGVGSRARVLQPKLRPAAWQVTEWKPGERFTWISRSPGSTVTAEHMLAAEAGGCRLTLTLQFQGLVGTVVGALASGLAREYLGLEARGLKKRAEASAAMC